MKKIIFFLFFSVLVVSSVWAMAQSPQSDEKPVRSRQATANDSGEQGRKFLEEEMMGATAGQIEDEQEQEDMGGPQVNKEVLNAETEKD